LIAGLVLKSYSKYVVYRASCTGTDPGGSCTGSHYDWLAWHGAGLQATGTCTLHVPAPAAKWELKMASTFKRLVIWRSSFLEIEA